MLRQRPWDHFLGDIIVHHLNNKNPTQHTNNKKTQLIRPPHTPENLCMPHCHTYQSNLKGKHAKESQRNTACYVSPPPRGGGGGRKTFQTHFTEKLKIYLKRITNVLISRFSGRQKDPILCPIPQKCFPFFSQIDSVTQDNSLCF